LFIDNLRQLLKQLDDLRKQTVQVAAITCEPQKVMKIAATLNDCGHRVGNELDTLALAVEQVSPAKTETPAAAINAPQLVHKQNGSSEVVTKSVAPLSATADNLAKALAKKAVDTKPEPDTPGSSL
jgi:uncharacterized protein YoxC